jgi:gamma-tubulin complex component 2
MLMGTAFAAIDALTLDYNVKFPLSLVVSRKTILRYQLLFRFLLHLKHVEQSLAAMWIEQKTLPWRKLVPGSSASRSAAPSPIPSNRHPAGSSGSAGGNRTGADFEMWRLRVFLLRARMLSFVQQILSFATFEVLEPNWRALEKKLEKVTTVDQLLKDHVDFLDTCLKECMLTSAKLLKAYSRLIVTCSTFALYAASFTKSANQALAAAESAAAGGEGDPAMDKRWDFLSKFERNFDHWYVGSLHH